MRGNAMCLPTHPPHPQQTQQTQQTTAKLFVKGYPTELVAMVKGASTAAHYWDKRMTLSQATSRIEFDNALSDWVRHWMMVIVGLRQW